MNHDRQLSSVLSEFARTLGTDFPIQAILEHLMERITDVLPVTSVGVTLIAPGLPPEYIVGSDPSSLRYEQLQSEFGQGPCLVAYETGESVSIPDLTVGDARFPVFCQAGQDLGLRAVFAFPLRHNEGHLGSLDLYRDRAGPLEADDMAAAQTLADVTAAYLLNARSRQHALDTAERLRIMTLHDSLTGLPNRVLLETRLEHAAARAVRSRADAAVLFVDLDKFKAVNDTHGHPVGDALLIAVAHRLSAILRPGDTLARVSGDEFVILCEDLDGSADVEDLAVRIEKCFRTPFMLLAGNGSGIEMGITASVGIAFSGHGASIGRELIGHADAAMYQAKRKGTGLHQVLDLREVEAIEDQQALTADLQAALADETLEVWYQPIVRADSGLLVGTEALLRWTHPTRGPVPPVTAVALAERSDLILSLGQWVLTRACRDHRRWQADHPVEALTVAVNISPRQLMAAGFADMVATVLSEVGMEPYALVLEVTETIFLVDAERALTVLLDLKTLGVQLALGDFGTGYSSLSYLRHFPVNIIKIDRSFIAEIGLEPYGSTIVTAVTNLAHGLGLGVTAEGVETTRQHHEVVAIGCDYAQGYRYGRAMTSHQIHELLHDQDQTRPR